MSEALKRKKSKGRKQQLREPSPELVSTSPDESSEEEGPAAPGMSSGWRSFGKMQHKLEDRGLVFKVGKREVAMMPEFASMGRERVNAEIDSPGTKLYNTLALTNNAMVISPDTGGYVRLSNLGFPEEHFSVSPDAPSYVSHVKKAIRKSHRTAGDVVGAKKMKLEGIYPLHTTTKGYGTYLDFAQYGQDREPMKKEKLPDNPKVTIVPAAAAAAEKPVKEPEIPVPPSQTKVPAAETVKQKSQLTDAELEERSKALVGKLNLLTPNTTLSERLQTVVHLNDLFINEQYMKRFNVSKERQKTMRERFAKHLGSDVGKMLLF